jgi:surfeit locus 1 family protein
MLVVLIGLGTWQVHRLHWKEAILARLAAAESAPPVPLAYDPVPYTKIMVTGRFLFDRAAQFGAEVRDTRTGPMMGFYQIVPLERDGARPVLVIRGWIPQKRETALDDPAEVVTLTGYVRPDEKPSWFSATDDAAVRQFYTLDPQAIGAAVGVPDPAPFILVALGSPAAGSYPSPAQHLPRPPNNHLSYVITWYGLAASLVVIFGVWARKAASS